MIKTTMNIHLVKLVKTKAAKYTLFILLLSLIAIPGSRIQAQEAKTDSLLDTLSLNSTTEINSSNNKSIQSINKTKKNFVELGLEIASLAAIEGSLTGYGLKVGFHHALDYDLAIGLSLSQIFGQSSKGNLSALYSAISGSVQYAIFGKFTTTHNEMTFKGEKFFEEIDKKVNTLAVGAEINQLLLNGANSVYPATGLSLSLSYEFSLLSYWWRPSVRFASLAARDDSLTAIIINLSVLIDL